MSECIEPDCSEPRKVSSGGREWARCVEHHNKMRRDYMRGYYGNNPEYAWEKRLQARSRKTGVPVEVIREAFEESEGFCACCFREVGVDNLVVDHCHTTGKFRALLCSPCNTGLGHFGDSVERLKLAIQFLEISEDVLALEKGF